MGSMEDDDPSSPSPNVDSVNAVTLEFGKLTLNAAGNVADYDDGSGGVGEEECEDGDAAAKTEEEEGGKRKTKDEKQRGCGDVSDSASAYLQRPEEPDCSYYMKRGTCKYGQNCRYNHPLERRNPRQGMHCVANADDRESFPERVGQPECKHYLKTGTCKFGESCKYHHPRDEDGTGRKMELNFLGLPIRPGERECPFYMRTGSCKYATNCKFHHPDPMAIGSSIPVSGYQEGGWFPIHPWGALATLCPVQAGTNDSVPTIEVPLPYMPDMLQSHPAVVPIPGWNDFPDSFGQVLPSAATMNEQAAKMADYPSDQHQRELLVDFPERPGQLECQYYLKTGSCKFRSACKYHHPKNRLSKLPMCTLSPMGLPLRPNETVCSHYSRFGICKFGPMCKFDHPPTYGYQAPPATFFNDQYKARDPSF